jgi:hypothetical protein
VKFSRLFTGRRRLAFLSFNQNVWQAVPASEAFVSSLAFSEPADFRIPLINR